MSESKKAGSIFPFPKGTAFPTLKVGDLSLPIENNHMLRGVLRGITMGNVRVSGRDERGLPVYEATEKGKVDLAMTTAENRGAKDGGHRSST